MTRLHAITGEMLLAFSAAFSGGVLLLFVLAVLAAFAYTEGGRGLPTTTRPPSSFLQKETPSPPTIITLSGNDTLLVNANPFPRQELRLVFLEMTQRKPSPSLVIRCCKGVRLGSLLEVLSLARKSGIQDIRLAVGWEKP